VQARGSHQEVASGKRLRFGRNWSEFLKSIDEERIGRAEESLKQILNIESLRGRSFIDIVSGRPLRSFRDYQASRGTGLCTHDPPEELACEAIQVRPAT
jgi:hypothetical protein